MKPLSPILYFRRNLVRTLPVLCVIALAVLGVLAVGILAESQMLDPRRAWIDPTYTYARVYARSGTLDPNIAAELRAAPDVERVVSLIEGFIRGVAMFGSQDYPVNGLPEKDMDWYMQVTGTHLTQGRLPQGSRSEVALHDRLLRSKGLNIGDWVGHEIDPDEWLPGKFQVVGRLDGPIQMGIATAQALRSVTRRQELHVFAKPGRMAALDQYLRTFSSDDVDVYSVTSAQEKWARDTGNISLILLAINGITIFVLSMAVGLLNQIYFLQRIPEYGILLAMGFRISAMVLRTMAEALTLTITGWLLGLGLSWGLERTLQVLIFAPAGRTLAPLSPKVILSTLPIPVLIGLFSLYTVIRRLVTMDPVSIVERRD